MQACVPVCGASFLDCTPRSLSKNKQKNNPPVPPLVGDRAGRESGERDIQANLRGPQRISGRNPKEADQAEGEREQAGGRGQSSWGGGGAQPSRRRAPSVGI